MKPRYDVNKLNDEARKRETESMTTHCKVEASFNTIKEERDKMASFYHEVVSSIRQLAQRVGSKKDTISAYMAKVWKLYNNSYKVIVNPFSTGPNLDVRIAELEYQLEAKGD